jgi:hypothetical protein
MKCPGSHITINRREGDRWLARWDFQPAICIRAKSDPPLSAANFKGLRSFGLGLKPSNTAPHVRLPARARCRYLRLFSCQVGQAEARTVEGVREHETQKHLPPQAAPRSCSRALADGSYEIPSGKPAGFAAKGTIICEPAGPFGMAVATDKNPSALTPLDAGNASRHSSWISITRQDLREFRRVSGGWQSVV